MRIAPLDCLKLCSQLECVCYLVQHCLKPPTLSRWTVHDPRHCHLLQQMLPPPPHHWMQLNWNNVQKCLAQVPLLMSTHIQKIMPVTLLTCAREWRKFSVHIIFLFMSNLQLQPFLGFVHCPRVAVGTGEGPVQTASTSTSTSTPSSKAWKNWNKTPY